MFFKKLLQAMQPHLSAVSEWGGLPEGVTQEADKKEPIMLSMKQSYTMRDCLTAHCHRRSFIAPAAAAA